MLLQTEKISKQFNGVYALKGVSMEIRPGEVHGLVGENGAGKSTLIKILTGVYSLEEGDIFWEGKKVRIETPEESKALGIHVLHQDRVLIPSFGAAENCYLGMDYPSKNGRIDRKKMRAVVEEKAAEFGIELDFKKTASQMTPPQKTCLEIVRAMMTDCKLLILDEPTASLTDKEAEILFGIIQRLKEKGTAILYVTHRMDEIFRLTDRITILRNGILSDTVATDQIDRAGLIGKMTEQWIAEEVKRSSEIGETLLKASHVSTADGIVKDVSLEVHKGEILGVFGLGGSGRTELLECLYGYRSRKGGTVVLNGNSYDKRSPFQSIQKGLVLISEDRRGKAMVGSMNVRENTTLSHIDFYSINGLLRKKAEISRVVEQIDALSIKTTGTEQNIRELSGGNQQKVVFAKSFLTAPNVFLCDEPTQAVDVKTRNEIHRLLRGKAEDGCGILFVSSDLQEILEVSDRIQIISGGCTYECLENNNLSSTEVLKYCYRK